MVSIISPCFNGEKYLHDYLLSVLNQTYPSIELILVDDASTDGTNTIIDEYVPLFEKRGGGSKLIYIRQEQNKGQAAAINRGLEVFSGEYVTWMDSDDIYFPNAIESKVNYLEKNTDIDFVLNRGIVVNEKDLNKSIGLLKRDVSLLDQDNLFKDLLDEKNVVFCPGCIMSRSSSLRRAIPSLHIYESREGQNWQLMLPLAYCCKYGYLNEILFKYVVHDTSHSHMKRTYEMYMQRRTNFYVLQEETIKNIPDITNEEMSYWIMYCKKIELYNKYIISLGFYRCMEALKYKKELLDMGYLFSLQENPLIYCTKKILKRLFGRN